MRLYAIRVALLPVLGSAATRVLQECYKSVTRVLQECYREVLLDGAPRSCHSVVTVLLQCCHSVVTVLLQWCYKSVTRKLPGSAARRIPLPLYA